MTIIRSYVAEILDGSYGTISREAGQALSRVGESARGLAAIIDDYLNVSRIEQGQMKYEIAEVDLAETVSKTVADLTATAQAKGLRLTYEPETHGSFIAKLDGEKMHQVITNLIDNAIKYTPKGSVTVRLMREPGTHSLLLSVTDTGMGIDPQVLPELFQKFSRAPGAGKANAGGSGLGLYVARQLLEAQGGRIWAESSGVGQGATFLVRIPAA